MEPRPTSRRAAPPDLASTDSVAPPPDSSDPSGGYSPADFAPEAGSAATYDPYTAPEATSYFAPMPGGAGAGEGLPRLGPLADEPVFYPNPSLPPNRPNYDPETAAYQRRADFALHPVGRVPPDHQPLNLRPAPPPAPPPVMPSNRDALIRGILAAVIGLAAVVLLVIAILAWSDNVSLFGGSGDPTPTTSSLLAGPSGASGLAVASGSAPAPAAASGSAAGNIPIGGAPSPSGAASGGNADVGPGTAPVGSAGQDTGSASASTGGSQPSGSSRPRSSTGLASARPSGSGGTNASGSSGDINAYLPDSSAVPDNFSQTDAGERTKDEVAATFGPDPSQASANLDDWGWQANSYVVYDATPQPPNDEVNRLGVSVHQFDSADGAAAALPAFVESFGAPQIDLPADANLGDNAVAMQTTNDDGNLVVLYVQKGNYVLKIDAASISGDPMQAAIDLAQKLVG